MNVAIKAGAILAVAVSLVSAVVIGTGLHQNMLVSQLLSIGIFIALNVGAIIWALRQTASTTGYGGQLLNALVLGVVGGVLITVLSFVMLSFVFPDALDQMRDAALDFMEASGMSQAQIDAQTASLDGATPMSQSLPGGIATVITSLVVGAITAIFFRKKSG